MMRLANAGPRALALTILAAVTLLGWQFVLRPLATVWFDAGDRADRLALLAHLTQVAQRRAALEQTIHQLDAALADPALLWSGSSGPGISANMQAQLQDIVVRSGGWLRSATDLPATAEHGLSRITLRLDAQGSIQMLQAMLQLIEAHHPALFVEEMEVNAPSGVTSGAQPPLLSIQLEISGYARPS